MPTSGDHARVHYQEQLDSLEGRALGGLDLVVEMLERAMESVRHQDIELAELVIADDDRVDGRYLEIHQELINLIATQAPVATDLRLISALLYVMKSIERMGDQCVNVAKLVPVSGHNPPSSEELLGKIERMGEQARSMIGQAKHAFADRNAEMARDLVTQDDVIDRCNREAFRLAIEIGDDQDRREWAMTMLLVARALERIGDNAVDIGEQIAFVVTGMFREFEDASHPGDEVVPQSSASPS
jgi:phosphate transport system protein